MFLHMTQGILMKKRWIFVFALITACIFTIAACSKKDGSTSDTVGTITPDSVESGELTAFDYMENDLTPYVTLGNYEGLHGTLAVEKITEARLDEELDQLAQEYGHYNEITERDVVEEGDRVIADYAGTQDGVAFAGGTATDQEIVVQSDSGYIPGFAEAFIGQKVGETFSFDITFPENYHNEDMAGKAVTFTCTVHTIYGSEWIVPTIDDAFVTENFHYNNLEEFKISFRSSLESRAQYIGENNLYVELWEQLLNDSTILSYPAGEVEGQYENRKAMYTAWADYYGTTYEDFLTSYVGTTDAAIMEECRNDVREDLVLYALVKAMGHTLTEDEFNSRLVNLAAAYGTTPENMLTQYEESSLRKTLLWESAMAEVASMAEITKTTTEVADS